MTSTRGPNWPLLAIIAACVILAAPLWCVASPAMPDYPAHVANFYLITGGASHYYHVEWAFLPNLDTVVGYRAKCDEVATNDFEGFAFASAGG